MASPTIFLGAIAEKVSGLPLEQAMLEFVCKPLGMNDAQFGCAAPARLAVPYGDASPKPERMREPHAMKHPLGHMTVFWPSRITDAAAYPAGSSGMSGTAADFAKFLSQLVATPNLFSAQLRDQALIDRLGPIAERGLGAGLGFSLFGAVATNPGTNKANLPQGAVWWNGVFGSSWFVDPANKIALVSLTNTAFEGCNGAFPMDLRKAVYASD